MQLYDDTIGFFVNRRSSIDFVIFLVLGVFYFDMSYNFVEFIHNSEGLKLEEFTRDEYEMVFVKVVEEHLWEELCRLAEENGYVKCGEYEHQGTMERMWLFSQNEEYCGKQAGVYAPVDE